MVKKNATSTKCNPYGVGGKRDYRSTTEMQPLRGWVVIPPSLNESTKSTHCV